jgi:hypothetical protein
MAAHPTALPKALGPIIVPPTPRRSANMDLQTYMQAVDVWTKQAEQALRAFERTVNAMAAYLESTQNQLVPAGGTAGQKLTKSSNTDFDDGWV